MNGFLLTLTGGIGGAKLCVGLQRILSPDALRIVVNTGDDFQHLGLYVSPDIDTTLYTLGGLSNAELGWGRRDETWTFMRALETLGGETWFRLGDGDLATHVERTRRLASGERLSTITREFARRLRVGPSIIPMSDDEVHTRVITPEGELDFQQYFVRLRCEPVVTALRFEGCQTARTCAEFSEALRSPALRAIVIAPSNPYLSIDPILSIPNVRKDLRAAGVPIVAVTPIIGGSAVKGPTAKIMKELGFVPSPLTVIHHYEGLIDGFVLDSRDAALSEKIPVPVELCDTLMHVATDRERVARSVVNLITRIADGNPAGKERPKLILR